MAKLDRLGWAAHRAIRTHGVRIGFRATRKNLLDALDPHLPPDAAPSRSRVVDRLYSIVSPINQPDSRVRRYQIVYSDAMQVARTLDLNEALQQMPADATLEAIQHVVQLRLDPTKVLQAIGRLMSGATVVAGTRGEADETASALLARLDEEKLSFRRSKRVA